MDEEAFNMSVRKFLKQLGVTSQREIEAAVRERLEAGELKGDETLVTEATVTVGELGKEIVVRGEIRLR
ncbi:MAG: hypothetical protein H0V03_06730 [Thermoleophilaceae bacterium]|nr:hypothetical protein [Thermoleophilaceae bacterium]